MTEEPSPKSILREMLEGGDTFATFVRRYRLERSEGLVLRYLTDAWRTLDRSLPDDVYTPALEDVVEWLGELIRATDATLLDEWTLLAGRPVHDHLAPEAPAAARPWPPAPGAPPCARPRSAGSSCWPPARYAALAERSGWSEERLAEAMAPYWAEYDGIGTDADARSAEQFTLTEEADRWVITQRLADPGRATASGASSPSSTSSWPRPRAPRPCGSTNSDGSDRRRHRPLRGDNHRGGAPAAASRCGSAERAGACGDEWDSRSGDVAVGVVRVEIRVTVSDSSRGSPSAISWRSSEMLVIDVFETTGVACGSSADVMRILVCGACE